MPIDLNELERLAKAALLPWHIYKECQLDDHHEEIRNADGWYIKSVCDKKDEYILAACNAVPELIAENRALRERVQMRQELVEQYEKDIARLRQKVRELEERAEKAEGRLGDCRLMRNLEHQKIAELQAELRKRR